MSNFEKRSRFITISFLPSANVMEPPLRRFASSFDVTDQGAGVHVFQPFELTAGRDLVLDLPLVKDGDKAVTLRVARLVSVQSIDFTIDVDDTGDSRPNDDFRR